MNELSVIVIREWLLLLLLCGCVRACELTSFCEP
jgi:hypothetical protein